MKKENIKIGYTYEIRGNFVIVTNILNGEIEVADVEFNEDGEPQAIKGTENFLTDFEVKHLKDE